MRDLRIALRTMIRKTTFTLLVLVTLGIGIGASTAIFSVVNAVLLRPLPYAQPDRLVLVWNRFGETGVDKAPVAAPDVVDYLEQTQLFEGFAAIFNMPTAITEEDLRPELITTGFASSNYFSLLGVELMLGEMYGPEDEGRADFNQMQDPNLELPSAPAILSYELWQRRYNGDPGVLGRSVLINGQSMFIQGVAPPGFRLLLPVDAAMPARTDVWTPFPFDLATGGRSTQWLTVIGRLKGATPLAAARAEMERIAAWQREHFEFHRSAGMEIRVIPMHEDVTGHIRHHLVWFVLAAGLLLLLTYSNVANLLILRSWERRREISIRAAMGGGPGRLARQVLSESLLLALAGGALGLLLGHWGIRLLLALQPENLPRVDEAGIDYRVVAVALAAAVVAAVAGALVPAIQSSRLQLAATLCERSATGTPTHQWLRKSLVVLEMAISLVLLISTGLVLRSATELSRIDPGFRTERVLTANVTLPFFQYPEAERRADFFAEVVRRAATIPGVEAASGGYPLPLGEGRQGWFGPWSVEGMNHEEWTQNEADFRGAMPGYFEIMGIRLLKGRFFTAADNEPGARKVAIVDRIMARRAWPDEDDPVDKRLMIWEWNEAGTGLEQVWVDVVGMIEHVREDDLTRDGIGTVFCPQRFYSFHQVYLTLRSATSDPMTLLGPLRDVVAGVDPDQPLQDVRLMQDYVDEALAPSRFALTLFGVFAAIAALLAAVGLHGVIASTVQLRSREIGIRMAFGAKQGKILRMELGQALVLTCWGLVFGLGAAVVAARGLGSLLFGVTFIDPVTYGAIIGLQVLIAVVAALLPAWRATRVDPVAVLKTE